MLYYFHLRNPAISCNCPCPVIVHFQIWGLVMDVFTIERCPLMILLSHSVFLLKWMLLRVISEMFQFYTKMHANGSCSTMRYIGSSTRVFHVALFAEGEGDFFVLQSNFVLKMDVSAWILQNYLMSSKWMLLPFTSEDCIWRPRN